MAASNSTIEKLVGDLQRDRMILDLAIKVSSGATALASQFVPALGTATAGIQLAASLIAAANAAVRQCGLTDATLRNPETNVKNVQKYFEVYFKDDTQVRGVIEIQADWLPSDIELSLNSWSTVQSREIKQGNLIKVSTGKIDRLLAEMVGQESKFNVADDALDPDTLADYLSTPDQLESDLEDYKQIARNAKTHGAHTEVQGVVEIMLGKLSEKRSKANLRVKAAAIDLEAAA